MQARQARKHGMSVDAYLALRADKAEVAMERNEARAKTEDALLTPRHCLVCGREFVSRLERQVLCGDENCRRRHASRAASASIMRRYYSDPEFAERVQGLAGSRRANRLGLGSKQITISYLLERDDWTCGICRDKIGSRNEASVDHIIPLSRGGLHSLENVQAAHRNCNYSKGNRGGNEQLLAFG